jgi:type I restriction enzyme M protein
VARYFAAQQKQLDETQAELDAASAALAELEEEHSGEDGVLGSLEKIAKPEVSARLKEAEGEPDSADEVHVLRRWLAISEKEMSLKKSVKEQDTKLDRLAYDKYPTLPQDEIKSLVIDDKWMARLLADVRGELDRVSQALTGRVRELAQRYETSLPRLIDRLASVSARVDEHLRHMGATWG